MLIPNNRTSYTATAGVLIYPIGFTYSDPSEIVVRVQGSTGAYTNVYNWEFLGSDQIQFTSTPPTTFEIYRATNIALSYGVPKYTRFNSGAVISSNELNGNFELLRSAIAENHDVLDNLLFNNGFDIFDTRYVNLAGSTMTGNLVMDDANVVFSGATANDFETTLSVVDPTSDNVITIPNVTGSVVTTGDTGTVTGTMIDFNTIHSDNVDDTGRNNRFVTAADVTQLGTLPSDLAGKADLSGGKLDVSQLPDLAISEYLGSVANQTAMVALTGQKGDWCARTDDGKVYVITGDDPTDNGDWTALTYPNSLNTDLSYTGSSRLLASSTGADVTLPEVIAAGNSGFMTGADKTKLDGIEAGATADQTAAEIRTLVETASDSNVFTDADHTKLNGISAGANNDANTLNEVLTAGSTSTQGATFGQTVNGTQFSGSLSFQLTRANGAQVTMGGSNTYAVWAKNDTFVLKHDGSASYAGGLLTIDTQGSINTSAGLAAQNKSGYGDSLVSIIRGSNTAGTATTEIFASGSATFGGVVTQQGSTLRPSNNSGGLYVMKTDGTTVAAKTLADGSATFGGAIGTSGQNTLNEASALKFSQESANLSQIRAYGSNSSTSGSLEFKVGPSTGAPLTPLTLNSNGNATFTENVGIGTTSPGSKLAVFDSSAAVFRLETPGVIAISHSFDGTDYTINNNDGNSGHPIIFGTKAAGAESMRIDSAGRLLLGTPAAPSVGIPASATFVVQGYAGSATGDSLISLQRGQAPASISSGAQLGAITFGANDGSPYAQIHAATDGSGGSSDYPGRLVFSTTADTGSAPAERMRIDSSGRLGLGVVPSAHGGNSLEIHSASSVNSFLSLTNSTTGSGGSAHGFNIIMSNNEARLFNREAGDMSFWTSSSERMRISGSGDLKLQHTGKFILTEGTTNAYSISTNGANGVLTIKDEYNNSDRMSIDSTGNTTFVDRVDVGGLTVDSNLTPTSGTSVEHFYGTTGGVIQAFDRDNGNLEPLRVRGSTWDLGLDGSAEFEGTIDCKKLLNIDADGRTTAACFSIFEGSTDKVRFNGNGDATFAGSIEAVLNSTYKSSIANNGTIALYGANGLGTYLDNDGSATFGGGITSAGDQILETGSLNVYQSANSSTTPVFNGGWSSGGRNITSTIFSNGSAAFGRASQISGIAGNSSTSVFEQLSDSNYPLALHSAQTHKRGLGIYYADTGAGANGDPYILCTNQTSEKFRVNSDGAATFAADATINNLTVGEGSGSISYNTALGAAALASNTTGTYNTAIGKWALYSNTTGSSLTSCGMEALYNNTTSESNVAVGRAAMYTNTTGSHNVAIGVDALRLNTTGYTNIAIGRECSYSNTTGFSNVAIGYQTLYNNSTGSYNVGIGLGALASNSTGQENTAVGYVALYDSTTANKNTAFGTYALRHLTTGEQNVAVGNLSLYTNTTGSYNTALGAYALRYSTSSYNTAVGREALHVTTTGGYNTAVGYRCLPANTTGNFNVAMGYRTMETNTTGERNTGLGYQALYANSTGGYATCVGMYAAYYNTTGSGNDAYGYLSLHHNTSGSYNTSIGYQSLYKNTTGNRNTAVGLNAGYNNTTGAYNVAIGRESLFNCTTGNGNIGIGASDSGGYTAPVFNVTTQNNRLVLGHTSITDAYVEVDWTVTSDARDKMNFAPVPYGLDFINQLKPTAYQFKVDRDTETPNGDVRYGFKAQDILALEGDNPVIIDIEDPDHLKYKGAHLVPVLVNAVQELTAMVKELQSEIKTLKG